MTTFLLTSGNCTWTNWMNSDKNPKNKGDDETIQSLMRSFGAQICQNPISLEVRSTKTWELVKNKFNQQFYEYFDTEKGFYCNDGKQKMGETCDDYQIRLCCPGKSTLYDEFLKRDQGWKIISTDFSKVLESQILK